jgi:hypothetical protein
MIKKKNSKAGGMAQVVEHLPSKHEAPVNKNKQIKKPSKQTRYKRNIFQHNKGYM